VIHIRAVTPSPSVPYDAARLIERIHTVFAGLPHARGKSNNQRYEIEDAALAAFSVFFSQSPSFLDSQVRMQKLQGKNNATALFGVHEIPCDNQIRNMLDPVPPQTLFPLMAEIGDDLYRHGLLDAFRAFDDTFLIALDGTDFFSSQKISCPCCSQSTLANGKTLYRHIAVTPVLVAPGQENVIALAPQFVQPQDGHAKQDCELAASGRWLAQWGAHYAAWGSTFLGDDLYCHQPFCQQILAYKAHFIFTCKPDSHPTLYEWVDDLTRNGGVATLTSVRRVGKKQCTDTYRYVNQVPLRNSDDALMVNWCELVTTAEDGKVLFRNAWASSHPVTRDNVAALALAGRARWKIENENNNTLKTKGYHFGHNFGHGKQHLSNLFATMILLAFLFHTTLGMTEGPYRTVRSLLPSRRTFFEHLRALIQYIPFDDWNHLFHFMLNGLNDGPHNTG
jgi:hypothetical protein